MQVNLFVQILIVSNLKVYSSVYCTVKMVIKNAYKLSLLSLGFGGLNSMKVSKVVQVLFTCTTQAMGSFNNQMYTKSSCKSSTVYRSSLHCTLTFSAMHIVKLHVIKKPKRCFRILCIKQATRKV